jgi:hypothetical protein
MQLERWISGVNAPGSTFSVHVIDSAILDDKVLIPAGAAAFGEAIGAAESN